MFRARVLTSVAALSLVAGACSSERTTSDVVPTSEVSPAPTAGPVAAGCALDPEILLRIARGHDRKRSEDVTWVPEAPNYWGTPSVVPHSGPWDYLQEVPLVLYGPGRVAASGDVGRPVTLADVYPTVESLLGTDLKDRRGALLTEALAPGAAGTPKLIVGLMWDGVGKNVLARWPDATPHLERIMAEGTSYTEASVGSSPSMTPATHATFATGTFPDEHRLVQIVLRGDDGAMTTSFRGREPSHLARSTFADQFDRAVGNRAKVGLLAWRDWHMPMLGKGAAARGGDRDQLGLIGRDGKVTGNRELYATPRFLKDREWRLAKHLEEQDRSDGAADRSYAGHGHDPSDFEDSPAWVRYQTDLNVRLLRKGGYGRDATPDILLANYKATDIAGHQHALGSPEMRAALAAQDEALGRLLRVLDREVGDYVVIVTADHGHTPSPKVSGGWPIRPGEAKDDLDRAFDVPRGENLIERSTVVGAYLDRAVQRAVGATARDVARFFAAYTIRDSAPRGEVPPAFSGRGSERVMAAAWARSDLPAILACAGVGT